MEELEYQKAGPFCGQSFFIWCMQGYILKGLDKRFQWIIKKFKEYPLQSKLGHSNST